MMEENNNIFLTGSDALVYLAKPMYKKYFTKFVCGHPFSTCVSHDQFFSSHSLYVPVHILDPSSISPVAYVFNRCPIFQPKNR